MHHDLTAYMLEKLKEMLQVDSTTGQNDAITAYLVKELKALGYAPVIQRKGGVSVDLGGEGRGLVATAHVDDIGLMVRYVNPNGTIRVINVGGLYPFQAEWANVRVYARGGNVYTGTMRRSNSSLHLMDQEERMALADYDKNLFLFLDEDVTSAEDVAKLGIRAGDIIGVDPMTCFTQSGYIKSRFLDDKASAAVLLAYCKALKDGGKTPSRHVSVYFSLFEEVGHGGASCLNADTEEVLALDIGCCGPHTYADERKTFICLMDKFSPYHRPMADALIAAAERAGVQYVLDLCVPSYGSDADAAVRGGADIRHGLIGPGVLSTHGYERTHVSALAETFGLLWAYLE